MVPTATMEWRGSKAYGRCVDCGHLVQANKPVFGSLHFCVTSCEKARVHLDQRTRRCGPFWRRRTERYCAACQVIQR